MPDINTAKKSLQLNIKGSLCKNPSFHYSLKVSKGLITPQLCNIESNQECILIGSRGVRT